MFKNLFRFFHRKSRECFEDPRTRAERLGIDLPVGSEFPRVVSEQPGGRLDYRASDLCHGREVPLFIEHTCVEIEIKRPGSTAIRRSFIVDKSFFEELPKDRELPFAGSSREKAALLLRRREVILSSIGHKIAVALLDALASRDHMFGYSPEEWGVITRGMKAAQPMIERNVDK